MAIDTLAEVLVEGATSVDGTVEADSAHTAQVVAFEQVAVALSALAPLHRPQVNRAQVLQRRRNKGWEDPAHLMVTWCRGDVLVCKRKRREIIINKSNVNFSRFRKKIKQCE